MTIRYFEREHRFLSNFYMSPVEYEGEKYPSVEHAYQAAKTTNLQHRLEIQQAKTAGQAKRLGRSVELRPLWEWRKVIVMHELLVEKFAIFTPLATKLLNTQDEQLVEGNHWHDQFWGDCECGRHATVGLNWLGKLLMIVREDLQ